MWTKAVTFVLLLVVVLQLHVEAQNTGPTGGVCTKYLCTYEALEELKEEIVENCTTESVQIKQKLNQLEQQLSSLAQATCANHLGDTLHCPAQSCKEIGENRLRVSSGYYYWVKTCSSCHATQVQCFFNPAPHLPGGWRRVAYLDMSDPQEQCPSSLSLATSPRRLCRKSTGQSCDSVVYPTHGIPYSKVCGRAKAYAHNSVDAFLQFGCPSPCSINQPYVDGISITHGSPREHMWSYAASAHHGDSYPHITQFCPCALNSRNVPPSFVGNDYHCGHNPVHYTSIREDDPLWDGLNCDQYEAPCCQKPNLPWFCKDLPHPTTDDIEVRVCVDEPLSNEDIWVELIELYVQ